jgi:hypothetical protein
VPLFLVLLEYEYKEEEEKKNNKKKKRRDIGQ